MAVLITVSKAELLELRGLARLSPPLERLLYSVKNSGNLSHVYFVDRDVVCLLDEDVTPAELDAAFPSAVRVRVSKIEP